VKWRDILGDDSRRCVPVQPRCAAASDRLGERDHRQHRRHVFMDGRGAGAHVIAAKAVWSAHARPRAPDLASTHYGELCGAGNDRHEPRIRERPGASRDARAAGRPARQTEEIAALSGFSAVPARVTSRARPFTQRRGVFLS